MSYLHFGDFIKKRAKNENKNLFDWLDEKFFIIEVEANDMDTSKFRNGLHKILKHNKVEGDYTVLEFGSTSTYVFAFEYEKDIETIRKKLFELKLKI